MSTSRKILIANRGEIAVRIARTAHEMGFGPVGIYSEADRSSPYLRACSEAFEVGPAPAQESYLDIDRVLAAAKRARVWGIHPGYGFLSENAEFAQACAEAGFEFIGPSVRALKEMGDKIRAREHAQKASVPLVPSTDRLDTSKDAQIAATKIGYPVLLKARAGGGGKGMRVVQREEEMKSAFERAQSEAQKAFGNSDVYMEKYLERARHIEVQVFGDKKGHVYALGTRECSVQRRHQKILEEAPASAISAPTTQKMLACAEALASRVKYFGPGTVEFLVDPDEAFYFLEMNTRLQVEHPVTEMTLGMDLVRKQIEVALGEELTLDEKELLPRGHAIEVRICAEDPANGFVPVSGRIDDAHFGLGPFIRLDSGVENGMVVPMYYDSLLAKLIAWAPTRSEALTRLERALSETRISGLRTNLEFLNQLVRSNAVRRGDVFTGWLEANPFPCSTVKTETTFAAVAAAFLSEEGPKSVADSSMDSGWWTSGLPHPKERRL